MQESSKLREIPVVIMSSENVPTRINRLDFAVWAPVLNYAPKAFFLVCAVPRCTLLFV